MSHVISEKVSIKYPPGLSYEDYTFLKLTFNALDINGNSNISILSITVVNGNDPPEIQSLPTTVDLLENVTYAASLFTIGAMDLQNHKIFYSMDVHPNDGKFFLNGEIHFCFHIK